MSSASKITPYKHQVYINPEGELFFYHQLEEQCEEMISDCYEPFKIGGMTYDAGRTFRLIDEIAFDQEVDCYIESLFDDGWTEDAMTYEEQKNHNDKVLAGTWTPKEK